MQSHLKVKVVSLAMEMSYIRRQEEKWKTRARKARQNNRHQFVEFAESNFWSQRHHRTFLKGQARSAHLAYGFMRKQSYQNMEQICYGVLKGHGSSEPNWAGIEATVERFSRDERDPQGTMQRFAEWLADAKVWYEANPARIKQLNAERPARVAQLKEATAARKAATAA